MMDDILVDLDHEAEALAMNPDYRDAVKVMRRAAAEIRHLRSLAGAVSQGPSFAEAIKGVSRRSVEPEDPR
jgi:hypothetical protein